VIARRLSYALLASLALHALPALPQFIGNLLEVEPEVQPDLEDDPADLAAPPPPPKAPRPEEVVPASLFHLTIYKETPPPPRRPRPKPLPVPVQTPDAPATPPEPPPPELPPPEPPPEPPPIAEEEEPEPPLPPEDEEEAVADADSEATETTPGATGSYKAWKRKRGADGTGRRGRPGDKPCPPPHPGVITLENGWRVERPLIDFYASNLRELQELGKVYTQRNKDRKPTGFRMHLARCSVLRQAGMKTGDIVHDVNGRKIYTLLQAVSAYFVLRNDPVITLNVTRGGRALTLRYEIDPVDSKQSRKERKAAARAAGDLLREARESRKRKKDKE
jgi:hypothetical protein